MDYITESSGRHLLRLSNLLSVPDYVKEASIIEEDIIPLPAAVFGRPQFREFPLDTLGHVWLSYGYCKSAGIRETDLLAKITKAAELHGITKDLEAIDQALAQLTKKASHDQYYAITIDFGQEDPENKSASKRTGKHGFYPLAGPFQVEESAVKMANEKSRIPLDLFVDGCRNIVKRAKELNVPTNYLPKAILEYGIERVPDDNVVKMAAAQRVEQTGDEIYNQIAEAALTNPESAYDYAELWLRADRQNGVKISKATMNPYQIMNSGPTVDQVDNFIESWVSIAGAPVPRVKVATMQEEVVRKSFAKEVADKLMDLIKQASKTSGADLTNAFNELEKNVQVNFMKLLLAA